MAADKLTAQQNIFVAEYIVDRNATQAAIRAGYSAKTAKSQGQRLLTNVDIMDAINKQLEYREQRTLVTADYVIKGIKEVADNTERDCDRLKAYELLGKHLKLFTEKMEHSGAIPVVLKDDVEE